MTALSRLETVKNRIITVTVYTVFTQRIREFTLPLQEVSEFAVNLTISVLLTGFRIIVHRATV